MAQYVKNNTVVLTTVIDPRFKLRFTDVMLTMEDDDDVDDDDVDRPLPNLEEELEEDEPLSASGSASGTGVSARKRRLPVEDSDTDKKKVIRQNLETKLINEAVLCHTVIEAKKKKVATLPIDESEESSTSFEDEVFTGKFKVFLITITVL